MYRKIDALLFYSSKMTTWNTYWKIGFQEKPVFVPVQKTSFD